MELTSDTASSDASHILNQGLPAVPSIVTPGPGFAAARWVGREYGALLYLRWDPDTQQNQSSVTWRRTDARPEDGSECAPVGTPGGPQIRSQCPPCHPLLSSLAGPLNADG